jgi:serine/threonine protein kinase
VVRVYDAGEQADGRPYTVMELVDGETLAEVLRQRGPERLRRSRRET